MTEVPHRGIAEFTHNDKVYRLQYTWDAMALIKAEFGDADYNLDDVDVLARFAAIGLMAHHPDMSADMLRRLSPPILPLLTAVRRAYNYTYYGAAIPPSSAAADGGKKKPSAILKILSWPLIRRLSGRELRPKHSGV